MDISLVFPARFHRPRASLVAGALVLCAACTSAPTASPASHASKQPSHPLTSAHSRYPSSIVVLGHSGTTGYNSDPNSPNGDAPANSWATGANPEVNSVYQRILAKNPAAKGHAKTFGVDGSAVDSLVDQELKAAAFEPPPGLVLIQSIDNDIQCDGTDPQNYGPFRRTLTKVLDAVTRDLPDADIFFVDQWANVKEYDRAAIHVNPDSLTGTGPCDVVNSATGKLDAKREVYLQGLVDHYFAIIVDVCRQYPTCRTDEGGMQEMHLEPADLTSDASHLSVAGQHKMAAIAFAALYPRGS